VFSQKHPDKITTSEEENEMTHQWNYYQSASLLRLITAWLIENSKW